MAKGDLFSYGEITDAFYKNYREKEMDNLFCKKTRQCWR